MDTTFNEDTPVQQTTAAYLADELGWDSIYAYNNEDFGPDSLLGRTKDRVVIEQTFDDLLRFYEDLNAAPPF